MPPKPPPDENLTFLWACLKNSDYNKIDMHAVAKTLNIKPGAAGTRFYRLKQRMDPEAAGGSSTPTKGTKRTAEESGMDGEEEVESPKKKKATAKGKGKKAGGAGKTKVKEETISDNEVETGEDGGEGDGEVFG